ncbi:MAG: hypothetical protein EP343_08545 [Deltaproteobacteria bacterium]|nr:MAG: hypothetical protein EP343_08545 [Deltaproteobacteria bacterium]
MLKPKLPPYDIQEWREQSFPERVRWVCQSWAVQGYGTPPLVYTFYLLKIVFYVWVWSFFCSFSPGLGSWSNVGSWWMHSVALQKAVLWSMAFEVLGLGCGSGPLTGRYLPPFGGFLYFLRPGTTKLPFWSKLPVLGGHRRSWLDVLLYLAYLVALFRALVAPDITMSHVLPIVVVLPLAGLADKTLFLASRGEHYYTATVCFLLSSVWIPASKLVWVAIWLGAATSKLNTHFPSVIGVMISNSPFTNIGPLRKWMYKRYPDDLHPSRLAHVLAHFGTVVEFTFPLVLLYSSGGTLTTVTLLVMLSFHIFITSHVPMGVPIEWNIMMVYGGFVLFGHHSAVSVAGVLQVPWLVAFLAVMLVLVPLVGNFFPAKVSFLNSMRYYAGNWAYSVWLFRGDASKKLDQHLVKSAPRVQNQLRILYDEDTITALISKVIAFRAMHVHGRALVELVPRAVDNVDDYEYLDGELVTGVVLGWNFGDGHLHNVPMLEAIQAQCQFEPGELRCVFVESQPMGRAVLDWTIADAAEGVLEQGRIQVSDLHKRQTWELPSTSAA